MKKSSFVAMMTGTVSMILFALGMCMTLVSEWNAFMPGIAIGASGLLLGFVTLIVWRKLEHKSWFQHPGKFSLTVVIGAMGTLALGVGMCFSMVWDKQILGIVIGLIGIVILLCLIPLTKGIKDENTEQRENG